MNCSHSVFFSHPQPNAMLKGTQMIVAVQKGHSEQWDATGLCRCPHTLLHVPRDLVLSFLQVTTHWAKVWFTFGLCPMSLTAEAKAACVCAWISSWHFQPLQFRNSLRFLSFKVLKSFSSIWVLVHCWLWVAEAHRFASNFSFQTLHNLITAFYRITKLLRLKGTPGGYPVQICTQSRVSYRRLLMAESTFVLGVYKDRLYEHFGQPVPVFK